MNREQKLEDLLIKLFDGRLDARAHQQLELLLSTSADARKEYREQCRIHGMLLEDRDLLQSVSDEAGHADIIPMFGKNPRKSKNSLPKRMGIFTGVAASILLVFTLIRLKPPQEHTVAQNYDTVSPVQHTSPQEAYEKAIAAIPSIGNMSRPPASGTSHLDGSIKFNRDIRPILSDNCFLCHGPDHSTRAADLRLDIHEGLLADLGSGRRAVIPGDPANSELFKRVTATDESAVMPPLNSHKHLNEKQIDKLRQWIEIGAPWENHWSFNSIKRPAVPECESEWPTNPIDHFILKRQAFAGLKPAVRADKHTLIRRVSFDLTGLPPTQQEIESFVNSTSPSAYEEMVDYFLASEKYGEHRARYWLDGARYSDTHGYHKDNYRSIWPYRDWVVNAYNRNMPFDRFTIEQIAGDMLPGATQSQKVATGFNRCNPTTSEGGAIDDEYYAIYAYDRVEATATVWLGLTMGCASCHDHKFDPISMKEFYEMSAFFRNTTQAAMDGNAMDTPPSIRVYSDAALAEKRQLEQTINSVERDLLPMIGKYVAAHPQTRDAFTWICEKDLLHHAAVTNAVSIDPATHTQVSSNEFINTGHPFSLSFWVKPPQTNDLIHPLVLFGQYDPEKENRGWQVRLEQDGRITLDLQTDEPRWRKGHDMKLTGKDRLMPDVWNHVVFTYDGSTSKDTQSINYADVFSLRLNNTQTGIRGLNKWTKLLGSAQTDQPFFLGTASPTNEPGGAAARIMDIRIFSSCLSRPEQELLAFTQLTDHIIPGIPAEQVENEFIFDPDLVKREMDLAREAEAGLRAVHRSAPITLVMEEKKNAEPFAHVLTRGDYASPAERVKPGVPAIFPALPKNSPPNRLALAEWLVNPENPLPARVTVNRFWQELFGRGIVSTAGDFGSQGVPPTHPELLDWLAAEFIDSGWNVKHMYKLMLMSSTYQQSADFTDEKLEADPENRLLARGPRFRLDAEMIRDQALFVSNLLVDQIGGKPVKPYQPAGIWKAVGYSNSNTSEFKADTGEKLYRRSLYTFWKRTAPPPSMQIFDAPTRESCTVQRERTNTPLQALVLLNDPQFVEAARNLAQSVLKTHRENKFRYILQLALGREPDSQMTATLKATYNEVLPVYRNDPEAAENLLAVGESPADTDLDPAELAAWTVVANQVMNMDAFITKN